MTFNIFDTIKEAVSHLNPDEVRQEAERPLRIGLYAPSEKAYQQMEAFFVPAAVSEKRRAEVSNVLHRASQVVSHEAPVYDLEIYSEELHAPEQGFTFYLHHPERTIQQILKRHPDLNIALARNVYPFREPVARQIVTRISKENALFSLATAIPDIMPYLALPWAIGEFASDTAVLTANQVRMAFQLAAASDRYISYKEQKGEIVSILLGAFGWRAIARELVGKIPFGAGLIPKAAVAYAGTRVAGFSLERYYRIGYGYTRQERNVAYEDALQRGRTIAESMLHSIKQRALPR
jgi:hypothetical protein